MTVDATDNLIPEVMTNETVAAPLSGEVLPISESNDPVFASKAMGDGVIILPNSTTVVAPFDGKIVTIFPTKHAIGLVSDKGCEVLIHIGINTVELEGKGFEAFVKQGDSVTKGQK